jgi:hypothetical protein
VVVSVNREELQRVVASVSAWPERDRITLARKILETVEGPTKNAGRGYTSQQVIDLLKMPQPAPDDAHCQAIVEEELMRKYGQ